MPATAGAVQRLAQRLQGYNNNSDKNAMALIQNKKPHPLGGLFVYCMKKSERTTFAGQNVLYRCIDS